MKYIQFKKHVYGRLTKEFGFEKEDKAYFYRTNDVVLIFELQKSDYSNCVYINIGVNPMDILEHWNLDIPKTTELSQINLALNAERLIYELDEITIDVVDNDLDVFFDITFPNLLSVESLKKYFDNRRDSLFKHVRDFWYDAD